MSANQVSPSPRVKPDSDMEVIEITEEELNPGKETDGKHVKKDLISRTQTFVKDMQEDMEKVGDDLAHGVEEMTRFISGKPPATEAYVRVSFCKRENTHARTHTCTHYSKLQFNAMLSCASDVQWLL